MTFLPTENVKVTNRFCQLYQPGFLIPDLIRDELIDTNQISTPTVNYVLLNWTWTREDRTNFYRLRVSFKRKSRYIKTDVMVHKSDKKDDKGNYVLEKAVQYQLDTLVMRIQRKIDALDPCKLELMEIDDLMTHLNSTSADGRFHLDFFEFAETVIAKKTGQPKKFYRTAVNCFKKYLEKEQMDISEISSSLMQEWEEWLRNTYGNNARAVSAYTGASVQKQQGVLFPGGLTYYPVIRLVPQEGHVSFFNFHKHLFITAKIS